MAGPAFPEMSAPNPEIKLLVTAGTSVADVPSQPTPITPTKHKNKARVTYDISIFHCDIIKNDFWLKHPDILS